MPGDIIREIAHAHCAYATRTGRFPQVVRLGPTEAAQFARWLELHPPPKPTPHLNSFRVLGMRVEVCPDLDGLEVGE